MTYRPRPYEDPDTAATMTRDCAVCVERIDVRVTSPQPDRRSDPRSGSRPDLDLPEAAAHLAERLRLV